MTVDTLLIPVHLYILGRMLESLIAMIFSA